MDPALFCPLEGGCIVSLYRNVNGKNQIPPFEGGQGDVFRFAIMSMPVTPPVPPSRGDSVFHGRANCTLPCPKDTVFTV